MLAPLATVTSTTGEVPTTPVAPAVCAASRWEPSGTSVVFQLSVYGSDPGEARPMAGRQAASARGPPDAVAALNVTMPESRTRWRVQA